MLTLPIMGKWFNMILSGDKQEEYREIKPYYTTRFKKIFEMYPNSNIPTGLDKQLIGFRNGYGSSRPQFTALCSLDVKAGKEEWGAEPGKERLLICSRQYLRHIALMSWAILWRLP